MPVSGCGGDCFTESFQLPCVSTSVCRIEVFLKCVWCPTRSGDPYRASGNPSPRLHSTIIPVSLLFHSARKSGNNYTEFIIGVWAEVGLRARGSSLRAAYIWLSTVCQRRGGERGGGWRRRTAVKGNGMRVAERETRNRGAGSILSPPCRR